MSATFRNEGKWNKDRFREEGGWSPLDPALRLFLPGRLLASFLPALFPNPSVGHLLPAPPLRPTPHPCPGDRCPAGPCVASAGSSRGGSPAQEEPGKGSGALERRRGVTVPRQQLSNHASTPQGRGGSANRLRLRQPRPYKRKSAFRAGLATGGGGPGSAPTREALRGRTPGTRPRAWPGGHWAVAFVQPLPKGRIAMGPTGLASDPGDAQPRPALAPTVRGQQIFN